MNPYLLILSLIDMHDLLMVGAPVILAGFVSLQTWQVRTIYRTTKIQSTMLVTLDGLAESKADHEKRIEALEEVKAEHKFLRDSGMLHGFKKKQE